MAEASASSGTISSGESYAWGENVGWLDFAATSGNVTVTDDSLSGYIYGENIGWVSLNCSNTSSCGSNNYKVANDDEGTLSGYAWGENVGWIHFAPSAAGVSISDDGVFSGKAYGENIGWINFDVDHPVTTDWRPVSVREAEEDEEAPRQGIVTGYYRAAARSGLPSAYLNSAVVALLQSFGINLPGSTFPTANNSDSSLATCPDLQLGTISSCVRLLQIKLNTLGYIIAITGPGRPGGETNIFGPLTQVALARYQREHQISPALGYFGPLTRSYLSSQ